MTGRELLKKVASVLEERDSKDPLFLEVQKYLSDVEDYERRIQEFETRQRKQLPRGN